MHYCCNLFIYYTQIWILLPLNITEYLPYTSVGAGLNSRAYEMSKILNFTSKSLFPKREIILRTNAYIQKSSNLFHVAR